MVVSDLRDTITATFAGNRASNQRLWSTRGLPNAAGQPAEVVLVTRRDRMPTRDQINAERLPHKRDAKLQSDYSISKQKQAYGVPTDLAAQSPLTTQMVWGPGTFGFSMAELSRFKDEQCPGMNLNKVHFDTQNHGTPGGDNFGEGSLDVRMVRTPFKPGCLPSVCLP